MFGAIHFGRSGGGANQLSENLPLLFQACRLSPGNAGGRSSPFEARCQREVKRRAKMATQIAASPAQSFGIGPEDG